MLSALPPLHNGHAPIALQQLFSDACYACEEWDEELTEPIVTFQGRIFPVTVVFQAMRGCRDIAPSSIVRAITARMIRPQEGESPLEEMSLSAAARFMGAFVKKRLLADGGLDIFVTASRLTSGGSPK
ncbi:MULTISPECIES: hypothetical protein [unclassified Sinorhizobium]|uniref:hypothetical protein n=1 Tax=unclassified Sinorhizobium TaxID=2613772 RepID=UPI00352468DD